MNSIKAVPNQMNDNRHSHHSDSPYESPISSRPAWKRPRRVASLAATFIMLALAAVVLGCSSDPDTVGRRGRSIEIHASRPVVVEKVAFDNGQDLNVIRPRASNRQLAAVLITVVNRTSTVMPLLVDPEAARLGDRRGERISALDPFESSSVADHIDAEESGLLYLDLSGVPVEGDDKTIPLLWGEVELDRHYQVQGWVLFDVPKGLTLGTLWWDEVDEVVADYVEYTRR